MTYHEHPQDKAIREQVEHQIEIENAESPLTAKEMLDWWILHRGMDREKFCAAFVNDFNGRRIGE